MVVLGLHNSRKYNLGGKREQVPCPEYLTFKYMDSPLGTSARSKAYLELTLAKCLTCVKPKRLKYFLLAGFISISAILYLVLTSSAISLVTSSIDTGCVVSFPDSVCRSS